MNLANITPFANIMMIALMIFTIILMLVGAAMIFQSNTGVGILLLVFGVAPLFIAGLFYGLFAAKKLSGIYFLLMIVFALAVSMHW